MKLFIPAVFGFLALSACSYHTQTSSGQEYLSAYKPLPNYVQAGKDEDGTAAVPKSMQEKLREVAAVEPTLTFPQRMGLARIEDGALTTVPPEELEIWSKTNERIGSEFGEFVPLSPMVARMASDRGVERRVGTEGIVDVIRLGAARQHVHSVLIYEVVTKQSERETILSAAKVTILGGYIVPSNVHETQAMGSAMFIDVMQGYPYGTVSANVDAQKRLSSAWGWGSDTADKSKSADTAKIRLAEKLAQEAENMLRQLKRELAAKQPVQ